MSDRELLEIVEKARAKWRAEKAALEREQVAKNGKG